MSSEGRAIGLDIGSTTVKLVVLGAGRDLLFERCERHQGRPVELAERLYARARVEHPRAPLGITGSVGVAMAERLGARAVHEVHAVSLAVRARHPETRSVVELGGQDAKVLFFDGELRVETEMNDRCAAGTGATIDRVAGRIGLSEAELGQLTLVGDLCVAAKCGVFAETDVVNLIKRGASPAAAFSALARAIVVQNLAVLTRGRVLRPPVLLLGGPHAHLPALTEAWRDALAALWARREVPPGPVEAPDHAALFAAVGAAEHAARSGRRLPSIEGVLGTERRDGALLSPTDDRAELARLTPAETPSELPPGPLRAHLGIDAGSTTSKLALLDEEGELLFGGYGPSNANPVDDIRARLRELEDAASRAGTELTIASVGVTGYGAELLGSALRADLTLVETVAHAEGAQRVMPSVDVVIDVGGTDVKIMCVDEGVVRHYHLSSQCSAGHGAFLAQAARDSGVALQDYAERALAAERMPRFTVGCSIFMDTDRVTFLRRGFSTDEILAGLAWALPRNIWEYVVADHPSRYGSAFLLTGGAARNRAAAWAQSKYLRAKVPGARVAVHPHPELCGAIGVALASRRQASRTGRASRFVGLAAAQLVRVRTTASEQTRCRSCELGCERSVVTVEPPPPAQRRRLVIGNACERGAVLDADAPRRGHATDALAYEVARLFRRPPMSPDANPDAPRIGIPRVMALYRSAPLLLHYLAAAGVPPDKLVLSPPTSPETYQEGARFGVHDPCFPSKLVLSHVAALLASDAIDLLLMPAITHAKIAVRGTTDTASCPIVAACGHAALSALGRDGDLLERRGIRALTPELTLTDRGRLEAQLLGTFGPLLGIDEERNARALEAGLAAQRRFHADCQRLGERTLAQARGDGRAVAVILARPYHADPGVQHGISTELAARGVPVLSIASLPIGDQAGLDLSDLLPEATNSGCAEKTWAARLIRDDPHLLAVDLSSFRCGQDASIMSTLSELLDDLDKPMLRMHDLDEDRPGASFRVRLETFAHSVARYEARLPARQSVA